jgi:hypothetical protein
MRYFLIAYQAGNLTANIEASSPTYPTQAWIRQQAVAQWDCLPEEVVVLHIQELSQIDFDTYLGRTAWTA